MYLIYCYTNKENGKKYIGITSRSMEEREASHIYESRNKTNKCYNAPFKRAIRKYGIKGFSREILNTTESFELDFNVYNEYIIVYEYMSAWVDFKYLEIYNAGIEKEFVVSPNEKYEIEDGKIKYSVYEVLTEEERKINNISEIYNTYRQDYEIVLEDGKVKNNKTKADYTDLRFSAQP